MLGLGRMDLGRDVPMGLVAASTHGTGAVWGGGKGAGVTPVLVPEHPAAEEEGS